MLTVKCYIYIDCAVHISDKNPATFKKLAGNIEIKVNIKIENIIGIVMEIKQVLGYHYHFYFDMY